MSVTIGNGIVTNVEVQVFHAIQLCSAVIVEVGGQCAMDDETSIIVLEISAGCFISHLSLRPSCLQFMCSSSGYDILWYHIP